jgi:carboxylate-amine ligase
MRFGLEGEYLLVEADTFRPLWHPDLTFRSLNGLLEAIPFEPLLDGLTLEGIEVDPPHTKLMPFYVEGYGLGRDRGEYTDLLPKGVEVRTPVCSSPEVCLCVYERLYEALQAALGEAGYRAVAAAHHPTAWGFEGPQNHGRIDWWRWAMQAMTTYGPDLNVSLPDSLRVRFDLGRLERRVNHYAPALVAFSVASPFGRGRVWEHRGRPGVSLRTYRRSPLAPAVAYHPKEGGRLEFKALDMPADRGDFHAYFLLWLWLVLDEQAPGAADEQDRVYDLGAVARLGWEAEAVAGRAEEALDRARPLLASLGVDPLPLDRLRRRLEQRRTPADLLLRHLAADPSIPNLLRLLDRLAEPALAPDLLGPITGTCSPQGGWAAPGACPTGGGTP